jgi:predicted nuclease of predicted toxin-antitoxin system
MRFLADENFPRPALRVLREQGFEIASVAEDSPGSLDEDVLTRCVDDKATLLTLDKDFGELVFRRGLPAECGVILFRVEAESPERFSEIAVLTLQSRDDWKGWFSVVSRDRVRMRRLAKPCLAKPGTGV